MNATVSNNIIQNITYVTGGRHVIGHVFEPVSYSAANQSNLNFENNTATNVTYLASTNREFIFVDYRATSSGGNVIITNNNFNMPSAGSQQAMELRFRQTNNSNVNVLVDNNGHGTGAIINTAVTFLDIDAEDNARVDVTITNNEFTNTNAAPGAAIAVATEDLVAAGGPPIMDVSITGNDLDATGNVIDLNKSAGDMNVTQASAAAIAAANGGATVNVSGTPDFSQPAPTLPTVPPVPGTAPLLAADGGVEAASGGTLGGVITGDVLAALAAAAVARWATTGLSAGQLATLDAIGVTVADLPGGALGDFAGRPARHRQQRRRPRLVH